jgi:hypothetical protein
LPVETVKVLRLSFGGCGPRAEGIGHGFDPSRALYHLEKANLSCDLLASRDRAAFAVELYGLSGCRHPNTAHSSRTEGKAGLTSTPAHCATQAA